MGARFGIENIHGMPKIMIHWDKVESRENFRDDRV